MFRCTALLVLFVFTFFRLHAQNNIQYKDSIVYRITYRDSIIYRYDTVHIRHITFSDTLKSPSAVTPVATVRKKRLINPNAWGIGPSVGAYYSPFNGFDVNIGFGVQYYFLAIPSFRNPHMKHARGRR